MRFQGRGHKEFSETIETLDWKMERTEGMKKRWGVLFWPIQFEKSMRNPMDMVGKMVDIHLELRTEDTAENKN